MTGGPVGGAADEPGDGDGSGTLIVTVSGLDSRPVSRSVATIVKSFSPRARLTSRVQAPVSLAVTS